MFTLPREEKEKFANVVAPQPQRGWTAVGVETTATLNTPGNINLSKVDNTGLKDLKVRRKCRWSSRQLTHA
jgi:hypothetical protein